MLEFFKNLFNTDDFPARWHCGDWESGHGWLHIISDTMIFGAYFGIPLALLIFAWKKHREILFAKLVWLFAFFILACGVGHLIEATIFWKPWYRFSGVVKAITAAVSWATLVAVIRQMPHALTIPGMVTVNRKLETSLEAQKKASNELKRSNQDLDEFAYIASHDLKAPLRSIRSLASWVAEDCEDILPQESKEHLDQLQNRVERLDKLLVDMLTYSRAGRDLSEPARFEPSPLIDGIAADLVGEDSDFKIEVQPDMPALTTWRVPFEQVMRNLISNGTKHHGGESGVIRVGGKARTKEFIFTVADDGQGIPAEFHDRIFGMFQTLKPKDEVEGSGMGLAIVAKLVERMGGRVELESHEGKGSTFFIHLPKEPPV